MSKLSEEPKGKAYPAEFGVYYDLGNGILEGIVNEGAELGEKQVLKIMQIVKNIDPLPKALLANRVHRYSFSFGAMRMISKSNLFKAIAVVNYGRSAKFEVLTNYLWPRFMKLRVFSNRNKAILWLKERIQ